VSVHIIQRHNTKLEQIPSKDKGQVSYTRIWDRH